MKLPTILLFVAILLLGWIIYTRPNPEHQIFEAGGVWAKAQLANAENSVTLEIEN
jgi:hypothetical protein